MKIRTIATVSVPGFHSWPDAPETVSFLRDRHRHLFHIRVEWAVQVLDRGIEFFMAQRRVEPAFRGFFDRGPDGFEFGSNSCEAIADFLLNKLDPPPFAVEVWEDGENGGRVERE